MQLYFRARGYHKGVVLAKKSHLGLDCTMYFFKYNILDFKWGNCSVIFELV